MATVTVRLPDGLFQRLRAASARTGTTLNQLIVATLNQALAHDAEVDQSGDSLDEQGQRIKRALGDLVVEVGTHEVPPHLRPPDDLPDWDTNRRSMPMLSPPLSATIIADRADRV